jgi:type IV pilus assembly protein PilP
VAIIWHVDNPMAMMEDGTGKGFIVREGTAIGRNEGVVKNITEDEVVIAEKTVNLLGETKTKEVRVSLHQEERK